MKIIVVIYILWVGGGVCVCTRVRTHSVTPVVSDSLQLHGLHPCHPVQETKIMASGPIPSWQIDGETVETVTDLIILGSKITAERYCSH